jgi:hypothetical protein
LAFRNISTRNFLGTRVISVGVKIRRYIRDVLKILIETRDIIISLQRRQTQRGKKSQRGKGNKCKLITNNFPRS